MRRGDSSAMRPGRGDGMSISHAPMRSLIFSLLLIGGMASQSSAEDAQPYVSDAAYLGDADWALVFSDEFEAPSLDTTQWVTCYWWADENCTNSGNKELQLYRADAVSIADGALKLEASHAALRGPKDRFYPYQSGIVTTARTYSEKGKPLRFSFQYGYAEIRAKLPKGKGLWPAFWLLPASLKSRPEIDVMEMLGDSPHLLRMHLHYRDLADGRKSLGETLDVGDMSHDWHRFGILWDKQQLVWFFDGKEQWRVSDSEAVPHEPMYMLLNLAVGGEWPGFPDKSTKFPADYQIDYVRVWQKR